MAADPACTGDKEPHLMDNERGSRRGPARAPTVEAAAAGEARSLLVMLKRFGPLLLIAAVMIAVLALGWHQHVSLENIVSQRERFRHVLEAHKVLAVAAYILTYIGFVALSLPGALILTVTGGLLFGWLIGGLAAVAGATIGATLLFVVARTALGDSLSTRAGPWFAKLREGFKEDGMCYLLFLRLVPAFPFWFVNIAPAILGVPLRTFDVATFFGIIPATFAFAAAGAGLDSVIAAATAEYSRCLAREGAQACKLSVQASSLVTKELILALVLLGLVALIPVALKKWRSRHAAVK
jgi:uncharacterized membrane protein YdjX (TVP38/TMEM64 family)